MVRLDSQQEVTASDRLRLLIKGRVQGVGFRPCVYRIANALELSGYVQNTPQGVLIEVEGHHSNQFLPSLLDNLPPLAKIDSIEKTVLSPKHSHSKSHFEILQSEIGASKTIIGPDISTCQDCLSELFDKNSRYYLYPFLNCTNCGPRLTITKKLPYDRKQTAMANFTLCEACAREYEDPTNRRYHAQPTSCADCGPTLTHQIPEIISAIKSGNIIALKGVGGYQLICDARNDAAIKKLRQRKNRPTKPFAIMVRDAAAAKKIAHVNEAEIKLLTADERPIVLVPSKNILSDHIAPGLQEYGIMLPYSPIHHMIFDVLKDAVLVVTSANISGNPLLINDEIAKKSLTPIADKIIGYNREIVSRADDSVVRIINNQPLFIRRARGYVPTAIKLPHAIPTTLALGANLKNTFCITRGDEAFVSQYIGSLNNAETIHYFHETLAHFTKFLAVEIECVAHDLHPDFYTTKLAQTYDLPSYAIQHHHAHLAAVAAEHNLQSAALGLALDGYGYGTHGQSWGGELFIFEQTDFQRLGHFEEIPLAGGDFVVREPWRVAAGVMALLGKSSEIAARFQQFPQANQLANLIDKQVNITMTSSCGRLFDAASAILGVNSISEYEGQAAMQLEALVTKPAALKNGWEIINNRFSMLPTLSYLLNKDPITGANIFHGTLIAGLTEWITDIAITQKTEAVILSGGCLLNKVLANGLTIELKKRGLKPYLPKILPPNDSGISLGQAWLAGLSNKK